MPLTKVSKVITTIPTKAKVLYCKPAAIIAKNVKKPLAMEVVIMLIAPKRKKTTMSKETITIAATKAVIVLFQTILEL